MLNVFYKQFALYTFGYWYFSTSRIIP